MTIDKQALADIRRAAIAVARDGRTDDEWFHYLQCVHHKNVLALLDELEAAEKRGADMEIACELYAESKLQQIKMEAANAAQDDHINQQADRIESLEKKNGELGRALGAAEQHIAELEARTLIVPDAASVGGQGYREQIINQCRTAGISIKGSE
ncbi:hypothetical protein [Yokenella regensburgei]|uniref:hypothetical protein n=1 Tax=Yokenella regensburgei TaxID=158877 RepID=UPI001432AD8A|nr:hypothetical protein [Yokenella regensburgei]QIU87857.1 hypothetical protein HEC60_08880 [Yokenella regensburgei]